MRSKSTLLVALALFVFMEVGHASGPLPPAKASVVVPLLRHYSPKDSSEKAVTAEMTRLLGGFSEMRHGPGGEMSDQFYELDDQTTIHIIFFKSELRTIMRQSTSARSLETLYPSSIR